jgi:hypothetical protein
MQEINGPAGAAPASQAVETLVILLPVRAKVIAGVIPHQIYNNWATAR